MKISQCDRCKRRDDTNLVMIGWCPKSVLLETGGAR